MSNFVVKPAVRTKNITYGKVRVNGIYLNMIKVNLNAADVFLREKDDGG